MMQDKEQQFERLFHSEYGRMYRAAHILLGNEEEAKDAVQDVFASLWDRSVILHEESQRTFLLTCVRNRCLNIIAQRQRQQANEVQLALANLSDDTETWLGQSDEELTAMVQQYIDQRLTPQTGRVIRMHYDDEQSYKEISGKLGISLSAVNKHIVQGLRKLRQQFNNREA
ncbi:MAG: sigma-70 family RNA polymerase sigma factor [Prevotella sp.]|nr:sigma-70 family RNA polymerase sigma factor [Prevotella sp.]